MRVFVVLRTKRDVKVTFPVVIAVRVISPFRPVARMVLWIIRWIFILFLQFTDFVTYISAVIAKFVKRGGKFCYADNHFFRSFNTSCGVFIYEVEANNGADCRHIGKVGSYCTIGLSIFFEDTFLAFLFHHMAYIVLEAEENFEKTYYDSHIVFDGKRQKEKGRRNKLICYSACHFGLSNSPRSRSEGEDTIWHKASRNVDVDIYIDDDSAIFSRVCFII